jgi:hypothetical protein
MKQHTTIEWLAFFGISLVDDNGWKGGNFIPKDMDITLESFVHRVNQSTILPMDMERYQIFEFLS